MRRFFLRSWEWLAYGVASGIVIFLLTRGEIALSYDSICYISMSKIVSAGVWDKLFAAAWPPFFPVLIALVSSLGLEAEQSARIVSVISYSVLVMAIFLLARRTTGRFAAHLASVSMLFFAPLLAVYSFCWSETVFITFVALSLLTLDKYRGSSDLWTTGYLILGAFFAGLALVTRYAGAALFLTGFLVVVFKESAKPLTDKIKALVVYSAIAGTPISLFLIGRLHYTGSGLPPANQVATSLWQNLHLLFSTIYHDFLTLDLNLADYKVTGQSELPIGPLSIIAVFVFLALGVRYLSTTSLKETIKTQFVSIAYLVCYSTFIVLVSTFRYRTLIESRLSSSLYPFIIILVFFVVTVACGGRAGRKVKLLLSGLCVFAVLFFWSVQLSSSLNLYVAKAPSEESAVAYQDIMGDEVIDVADVLYLTNYLFRGGPRPRPLENANVNCDGAINVGDVVFLIRYLYKDGPAPCTLKNRQAIRP